GSRLACSWNPAVDVERDEAAIADRDALALEQRALRGRADRIVNRDPAALRARLADHALPRQRVGAGARLERRGRDTRAARQARELGDLAVGRDAAARDRADDL